MNNKLEATLASFPSITLKEMENVKLMNRIDTKYITTKDHLIKLLTSLKNKYQIQIVDNENLIKYQTIYLDTSSREMFLAHQNGRRVREKIRVRTYISSNLTFLEVKNKDNHGRCDKRRIKVRDISTIKDEGENFLRSCSKYNLEQLTPQLVNTFQRITLVDNEKTERLTIDTDVRFFNLITKRNDSLGKTIIIELKRNGRKISYAAQLLHRQYIHNANISKYCVGMSMTTPSLKQNRFKQLLRLIYKLNN